ncbi:MAG: isopeptide-forming domain-containing fimbrial protein [Clostridiales bacterium]|nr:isopeptide-forming domain-containing fimbrial protein [Clostridiales bacterium]
MKKITRFLSLLLAAAMVLSLNFGTLTISVASAYTITIQNETDGYTYAAYQIFSGTLTGTGVTNDPYVLSNVVWGSGVSNETIGTYSEILAAIKAITLDSGTTYLFKDCTSAADVTAVLSANNSNSELAEKFAETVAGHLSNTATTADTVTTGTGYVLDVGTPGYYLVKNTAVPTGTGTSYTSYILQVLGAVSMDPKTSVPEVDKKVIDEDDSEGTTSDWQESADYDIGDDVPFQLTGTLPSNYADYDTYYYAFHDEEDAGLTFNPDSVKV